MVAQEVERSSLVEERFEELTEKVKMIYEKRIFVIERKRLVEEINQVAEGLVAVSEGEGSILRGRLEGLDRNLMLALCKRLNGVYGKFRTQDLLPTRWWAPPVFHPFYSGHWSSRRKG